MKVAEPGPLSSAHWLALRYLTHLTGARSVGFQMVILDHQVTWKTPLGMAAAGTRETDRDRHMARKVETCQLQHTGGSGDLGGRQESFAIITLV